MHVFTDEGDYEGLHQIMIMQIWVEHFPEIIKAAAENPRSLIASTIFGLSILAFYLFRGSKDAQKVSAFIGLMFFAALLVIISTQVSSNLDKTSMINYAIPLAIIIWGSSGLVYLAFLHSHWQENLQQKRYSQDFFLFIFDDLIRRFRNPLMLFPVLPIALLPFFILDWMTALNFFLIVVLAGIASLFFISNPDVSPLAKRRREFRRKNILSSIDDEWMHISKKIALILSQKIWFSYQDLYDLLDTSSIFIDEDKFIIYSFGEENFYKRETWLQACGKVMKKFASENIDVRLGKVYTRGLFGGECVSNTYIEGSLFPEEQRVLINMKTFPHDKYRIE